MTIVQVLHPNYCFIPDPQRNCTENYACHARLSVIITYWHQEPPWTAFGSGFVYLPRQRALAMPLDCKLLIKLTYRSATPVVCVDVNLINVIALMSQSQQTGA